MNILFSLGTPRLVHSIKILVVEDFEGFRRFICSALQQRPEFQVAQASDGLEALQKTEQLQPDLILLDIGLPKLNGIEVARRVLRLAPAARILFLSVESDPDVVRKALSLGAGYIHKLRAQSDLLPAVEAVLRGEQFVSRDLGLNGRTDAPRRHEVQFYSADSVLLESFTRFIATALKSGDAAIVLATKAHRDGIVQRLKAEGFDVDGTIQRGTYISLDADEMLSTIMMSGVPNVVRFFEGLCDLIESAAKAKKEEHPRIAICGEWVGLLCEAGNTNAAIQLEKAGNVLIETRNVDILCAYPLRGFDREENDHPFKSICAEHTAFYSG